MKPSVTYENHMGSDLTVVNAARVSFAKRSKLEPDDTLSMQDQKLIRYLARHGHWTPFGHPHVMLHFAVPIAVARQIHKHQTGFVVNEVSRRYVDSTPQVFYPDKWRGRAENKKQGSGPDLRPNDQVAAFSNYRGAVAFATHVYELLIAQGVAPEQARMVLPQAAFTEFFMTGSLYGWARFYNLRSKEDAQAEIQEIARQVQSIVMPLFPVSWEELTHG